MKVKRPVIYLIYLFITLFAAASAFFVYNPKAIYDLAVNLRFGRISVFNEINLENQELKAALQSLRADLAEIESLGNLKTASRRYRYLFARIYSEYPFSGGHRFIIDLGSADGLKEGMPVLAGPETLIGRVLKVGDNTSEVITIFDPSWQEPVRIGEAGVGGVLKGGREPKAAFIDKNVSFSAGDSVRNSSARYPLNFLIGEITGITNEPNAPFQEAKLKLTYEVNSLKSLLVILNHERD